MYLVSRMLNLVLGMAVLLFGMVELAFGMVYLVFGMADLVFRKCLTTRTFCSDREWGGKRQPDGTADHDQRLQNCLR